MRIARGWILLLLLSGCSGGGPSGTSTTKLITNAFLFQFNASINSGVTTRWPSLPITVDTGGFPNAEGEFNRWRDATGGAVTFLFLGSGAGIQVRLGDATPDTCAQTVVFFTAAGNITQAQTTLTPIWNTPACMDTIAHEAGHSIGFFGHTSDGGLMDPNGGNGEITKEDADMIRTLYSNPPGTLVRMSEVAKTALTVKGGLRSITFVTPTRRP